MGEKETAARPPESSGLAGPGQPAPAAKSTPWKEHDVQKSMGPASPASAPPQAPST